jgi:hypothetical protein
MGQLGTKRSFWNGVAFNICTTALKQMAFYPTQEVLKRVLVDKGVCRVCVVCVSCGVRVSNSSETTQAIRRARVSSGRPWASASSWVSSPARSTSSRCPCRRAWRAT